MTEPSASSLKSVKWFPVVGAPKPASGVASTLGKLAVGGIVGLALFLAHQTTAAIVVWSIAGGVAAISLASADARRAIDGALARFGRGVGSVLGTVLLSIVYIVVVTPTRYVRRLMGADDLHLRDVDRPTYWLPCDTDERKARYVGSMFATEVRTRDGAGDHPLRTALVLLALMFLLAEGVARTQGFGNAVLYHADPVVGYYPSPHQNLARYGGAVRTNEFGMRSGDIERKKAAGNFRILMLGDSTQYGGSYVAQEDIYSSRIEVMLNKLGGPGKVEVLAIGANGWGPFQERGYVTKFGTFEADLALINLPLDDVNRPLYGLMDVPFFGDLNPPTLALEEFVNNLTWRYRKAHAGLGARWEAEQSPLGIAEYGRLADDLHRTVPEVYGAILPGKSSGLGGPRIDASIDWLAPLEATFKAHHVVASYPHGIFKGKGREQEIYYDDVHLNPGGHQIYAEFLLDRLLNESARLRAWLGRSDQTKGGPPTVTEQP